RQGADEPRRGLGAWLRGSRSRDREPIEIEDERPSDPVASTRPVAESDGEPRRSSGAGAPRSFAPPKPPKVTVPPPPPSEATRAPAERRKGEYVLPPLQLLDAAKIERQIDERELMDNARLLEEKCREFSVEGSVVQIHPGPVVTTFEFKPDA